MNYDVFNGDADGICALHMLRLHAPAQHQLITGVKRDIELLRKVPTSAGTELLVLDISLDVNISAARRLLDGGARITWFDHHAADSADAQRHLQLTLHCDTAADVCTSILVDRHLQGQYRHWAVVAAFGDNLEAAAHTLARSQALDSDSTYALQQLGQVMNYNAYGESESDLHIAPAELYRAISQHLHPQSFLHTGLYRDLLAGYRSDCARLQGLRAYWQRDGNAIYLLPASPWACRINGVLANQLANRQNGNAFAVVLERSDGDYLISVRSRRPQSHSACQLCAEFPGGGGRKAAAGINRLPAAELARFIDRFNAYFAFTGGERLAH